MADKTAMIAVRLNPDVKRKAEEVFHELGLSTSDAVNLFFNQVRLQNGIPFEVVIPKKHETPEKKRRKKSG